MSARQPAKTNDDISRKAQKPRAVRNPRRPKQPKAEQAFYVYCIGEHAKLTPLFENELSEAPSAIESESGFELVTGNGLAAVVSVVPLTDYNEAPLQDHLGDAQWTAMRAMRHQAVLEYFVQHADVVPLRFGTVYLRRERVEEMLVQKQEELQTILSRLRGREEWGVSVYRDRTTFMANLESLSLPLREASKQAALAPPGQAYLLRKKMDAMRAEEARVETNRIIAEVEDNLAVLSDGMVRLRLLKDEPSEHGELAARLAFLVARSRFDEFRAVAEQLAQKYSAPGFRFELVGPWPAYNFAAE